MFRQETVSGDETILTVMGAVTGDLVAEFGRRLETLVAGRWTTITLDLTLTPAMTSEAIGKLILLRKRLVEQKKTMRVQGCSEPLLRIFKLIKLDTIMSIQP